MIDCIGVSVSYLGQIESDTRPITAAVLLALGREFSIEEGKALQAAEAAIRQIAG